MERYFATSRAVLAWHGGTVEKFIGDAVVAVFGIPAAHEDDALRAVRAPAELREALGALNEELSRERDVTLAVRTGVNTGEVVAGDPAQGSFTPPGTRLTSPPAWSRRPRPERFSSARRRMRSCETPSARSA